MKVRIITVFRDKDTREVYEVGAEREFEKSRAQHLISLGLVEEIKPAKPAEAEEPKVEEPKEEVPAEQNTEGAENAEGEENAEETKEEAAPAEEAKETPAEQQPQSRHRKSK